jgi:hypothetical protein
MIGRNPASTSVTSLRRRTDSLASAISPDFEVLFAILMGHGAIAHRRFKFWLGFMLRLSIINSMTYAEALSGTTAVE